MSVATLSGSLSVAGMNLGIAATREGEGQITQDVDCEKGYVGVLSTPADRAITTTDEAPDVEAADKVLIFWTAAGVVKTAFEIVQGVAGNVITLSAAGVSHEGDALPADATEVIIAVAAVADCDFDGDNVMMIGCAAVTRSGVGFFKQDDTYIDLVSCESVNSYIWVEGMGWTNPLTGDPVGYLVVASSNIVGSENVKIGALLNTVP